MNTRRLLPLALLCSILMLGACASAPQQTKGDDEDAVAAELDPFEGYNRVMFSINTALDQMIFRPVSIVYKTIVPDAARASVHNAFVNAFAPISLLNSILQGDVKNSTETFASFLVNTTWGIGGLFDVAKEAGVKPRQEDFGQTLGAWGASSGAYWVLPIYGPSSTRDVAGSIGDVLANPVTWIGGDYAWVKIAYPAIKGIDFRTNNLEFIDNIYNNSVDPYAAFRSLYLQRRDAESKNEQ